jgi:signal transduction histidine kinase
MKRNKYGKAIKIIVASVLILLLGLLIVFLSIVNYNQVSMLCMALVILAFLLSCYSLVLHTKSSKYNSELKETKKRLKTAEKQLKGIDEQKDEFLSMAAHELRAPMSAIKGYISMLIEGDAGKISDKAKGFLGDASAITERVIRLINNMLNVSRIEDERMAYQMEKVNLSTSVQIVYNQFRIEALRKGLSFDMEIPTDIKDRVHADSDRIVDVIGNMVSNAVKYTESGSVLIKLKQTEDKCVRFEVTDTGPGISDREQKKLFKKFYRIESNVGKTIGTGLGLYISKLLVEKFKGKIGLKSKLGEGSTFWFELPLVK